jgi:hypothetical protein
MKLMERDKMVQSKGNDRQMGTRGMGKLERREREKKEAKNKLSEAGRSTSDKMNNLKKTSLHSGPSLETGKTIGSTRLKKQMERTPLNKT